ncbi:FkbM family methyltransferase [Breoghania sp.]|uniref:FkbM family methyltransferase n=1 Tax=Breoghania sp. TaxID=2065378 RepID=UPI00262D1097|nr:FkbM family methyltransferase [Breoghania sp.]MDJ0933092.1 FkbM family methyltransferase [Breoghania sp.]
MAPIKKKYAKWRLKLIRRLRPRTFTVHGVCLPTDPAYVPNYVSNLVYEGRYERSEAAICKAELSHRDQVLELGGGIGFMGMLCAQICGSDNVTTYETNPDLERVIRKTHELNGVSPTLCMHAISREGSELTFFRDDNIISSGLIDRSFGGETTVSARAIADVLAEIRPTALVCDIEGAEIDVLADVDLSGIDKIIIELHPKIVGNEANDALVTSFEERGFEMAGGETKKVALFKCRMG